MSARTAIGTLAVVALVVWAAPAAAQDLTAEVRTWAGQAWQVSRAGLEVSYTVVAPAAQEAARPPGAAAGGVQDIVATGMAKRLFGSGAAEEPAGPAGQDGRRPVDTVGLWRAGVETRVPLARIASLTFTRQRVTDSKLPPHVAASHIRYAAAALFTDGSRMDADYVNLGTAVLRGDTAQGRVEIPWEDIEAIRFVR